MSEKSRTDPVIPLKKTPDPFVFSRLATLAALRKMAAKQAKSIPTRP